MSDRAHISRESLKASKLYILIEFSYSSRVEGHQLKTLLGNRVGNVFDFYK